MRAARSTPSVPTPATVVVFENRRAHTIDVEWSDFAGARVHYATIDAGQSYSQPTYAGHVWIVREGTLDLGVVIATEAAGRIQID